MKRAESGPWEARAARLGRAARALLSLGMCLALACSEPASLSNSSSVPLDPIAADPSCAKPSEGCPCPMPGEVIDCGQLESMAEETVTCAMGERTCQEDGTYSACSFDRKSTVSRKQRPLALGSPSVCPAGFDVCDPFCNITVDSAGGFDAGTGFNNQASGLTLAGTVKLNCDSLTLTPSTSAVTMTGSSISSASASNVTFTLTATPSGCTNATFPVTWIVDRFDRASITGTNNTNGKLKLAVPIGGSIKVTAQAAGVSASTTINVKVNVLEAPTSTSAAAPNLKASSTQISSFGTLSAPLTGSGSSTASWLYPYAGTYLPLALPAPVVQYLYTNGTGDSTSSASAVKISLRYPAGASPSTATFNYSLIVLEGNSVTCGENSSKCNFLDPQIQIPQEAWRYFELSARGADATLAIQRTRTRTSGGPSLETETTRNVHFVDGQLKGTVYYGSYTSPKAGNNGAILSIEPGATTPKVAVSPEGGTCVACHTINDDGSRLIANGAFVWGSYSYPTQRQFDLTTPSPSPSVLTTITTRRFVYSAPWLDAKYYLSHADVGGSGSGEYHTSTDTSGFYAVTNSSSAVSVSGLPSDLRAYSPRFSHDGKRVAFTFTGGASLPCSSGAVSPCTGNPRKLPASSSMTRLAVLDFSCSSPPCNSNSTGFNVSNARDVTPGVTDRVAWPSFTPDNDLIVYQRTLRSPRSTLSWTPSDVQTLNGAQAELWASAIPSNGSSLPTPVRLHAANGVNSGGTSYLPQRARTIIDDTKPLYTYRITRYDMWRQTGSGPSVSLSGEPVGNYSVKIDMLSSGSRGSATFRYSTNGGSSYAWGTYTTGASVTLGQTGLKAEFATGSYDTNATYYTRTGVVRITGTPSATGNQDVRIKIDATGARGTAKFKYSTNAGSSYSSQLTTAASVSLGTTGLIAEFDNITYESTSWMWGADVAHYHQDDAEFTTVAPCGSCFNNGPMAGSRDSRTNYYPYMAPTLAGNHAWVLFTSRRMYGNIAVHDGWDPDLTQSCSTREIPSKKLWVAAIDPNAPAGTDPSRPAFYLPGQETSAANSEGHWIGSACTAVDGACDTDEDCCGGTGTGATSQCRVISTSVFPPAKACKSRNTCSSEGQSCSVESDCCNGLLCPSGGGLCYRDPPLVYGQQKLTRTYVANCPSDKVAAWRFFEWQTTIPSGTNIKFYAQTREKDSESWRPSTPLLVGTASSTSPAGAWLRGPLPTGYALNQINVGNARQLLVTMEFNPNSDGTLAPTLHNWRQIFDCLDSE